MTSTSQSEGGTAGVSPGAVGIGPAVRRWFGPPRAHGEVDEGREVSFLELFYDLVFVVLIAQIAHTLAGHVSWSGVRDFVVVFVLIWLAWLNGTLYHELHGREDGRSRTFFFAQMIVLVVMSVYVGHAADEVDDGRGFAITYSVLFILLALQWYGVRRYDSPEFAMRVSRYLVGMAVFIGLMIATAIIDDPATRRWIWAVAAVVTLLGNLLTQLNMDPSIGDAMRPTASMVERFGLFTIIVLGEVVVGVSEGLSEADRSIRTIATGIIALGIGFGVWWNYFDFVGRRLPRAGVKSRTVWMMFHLPLTLSIAAAGAGMIALVEHAGDDRTPVGTAWLISGATAVIALSLAVIVTTMEPHEGRRLVPVSLVAGAAVALVLGALRPQPLILSIGLYAVLSFVWTESFVRHARHGLSIVGSSET